MRRRGSIARFRVPTLAERAGDFSQSRDNNGNIYNLIRDASHEPAVHGGEHVRLFPGRRRARQDSRRSPESARLGGAELLPAARPRTGQETNTFNAINIASVVKQKQRQETYRVDYQVSQTLRLSGKMVAQNASKVANGPFTQGRFGIGQQRVVQRVQRHGRLGAVPVPVLDHGQLLSQRHRRSSKRRTGIS